MIEVIRALGKMIEENKPCVLVTITSLKGSTPGKTGFKMLVGREGRIAGTVGGGGVEFYSISKCAELIVSGLKVYSETITIKESLDGGMEDKFEVLGDGKIRLNALCGGEVSLLYEVFKPARNLYIFGAGHVGLALGRLAKISGYYVSYFDNRQDVVAALPDDAFNSKSVVDLNSLPLSGSLELDSDGFAVVVTYNHLNDLNVLEYLVKNHPQLRYIGMIGSRKKVADCISSIKKTFGPGLNFNNLYSPVGLDLGGETPSEIAVSILAEIQAVHYGKHTNGLKLDFDKIK